MVIYLYNENQENLMITSLDGRTVMVTKDNSVFDDILEMCKDPNADFDMISILLNEDFWEYTSLDGKVSIMKESDDVYYLLGEDKSPLPNYLKTLISERRDNTKLPIFKERICQFLIHRALGDVKVIDAYMNKSPFIIGDDGFLLGKFDDDVQQTFPEYITLKLEDEKEVFYTKMGQRFSNSNCLHNALNLFAMKINFLPNFNESEIALKIEEPCSTYVDFWTSKGAKDAKEIKELAKDEQVRFEFGTYVASELCIFDTDIISEISKLAGNRLGFVRYWFEQ